MSWMVIKTLLSSTDPITEQEDGCSLDENNEFLRNLLDKLAQLNIHYWNKCHGWSSRHSCSSEIQLQSKRTGKILMRRMKDKIMKILNNSFIIEWLKKSWNMICRGIHDKKSNIMQNFANHAHYYHYYNTWGYTPQFQALVDTVAFKRESKQGWKNMLSHTFSDFFW